MTSLDSYFGHTVYAKISTHIFTGLIKLTRLGNLRQHIRRRMQIEELSTRHPVVHPNSERQYEATV